MLLMGNRKTQLLSPLSQNKFASSTMILLDRIKSTKDSNRKSDN